MRRKEALLKTAIIVMVILVLAGCSGKENDIPSEAETEEIAETLETSDESAQEVLEEQNEETDIPEREELSEVPDREEISIDYPFKDTEEYTLTLAKLTGSADEYELMLYGKDGEVLQQIPCGKLAEPITFAYNKCTWHDLEIFTEESDVGLLFLWKDERFLQEAIEIPKYTELRGMCMITVTENEDCLEKHFYELNEEKKRADEIRIFRLDRGTGHLEIQDRLENKCLFEGIAALDEEGNPVNSEYYDLLLWQNMYIPGDSEEDPFIPVWVGEKPKPEEEAYEMDSDDFDKKYYGDIFKNPGYTQKYESRQALLEEFGFADSEPMYQYFDWFGNLQLELYADDKMENLCGIVYAYGFNSELEKIAYMQGFTLCTITEEKWKEPDKYLLESVYGTSGADEVTDYEENTEYRADEKPDYSEATGVMDSESDNERETILKMNFVYREDGTLYCRDYSHNQDIFGTTWSSVHSSYDEKERVVYESGYITHGYTENYYIYEDESSKPAYCLYIDNNLGYAIPAMVKYY